jgi:hypothetical protein
LLSIFALFRESAEFYETEALRGGWSVRQLDRQINSLFYERKLDTGPVNSADSVCAFAGEISARLPVGDFADGVCKIGQPK